MTPMSPYWSSSVELAPPEESYLENEGDDRQEDEEGVREDLHLEQEPLAIVHWNFPEFKNWTSEKEQDENFNSLYWSTG